MRKTAILINGNLTALIGVRPCCDCGKMFLVAGSPDDPDREAITEQDDQAKVEAHFRQSIEKSVALGWRLLFVGSPNFG